MKLTQLRFGFHPSIETLASISPPSPHLLFFCPKESPQSHVHFWKMEGIVGLLDGEEGR